MKNKIIKVKKKIIKQLKINELYILKNQRLNKYILLMSEVNNWCLHRVMGFIVDSNFIFLILHIFLILGPKQQRKFKRLMLHRIKWSEAQQHTKDGIKYFSSCLYRNRPVQV